MTAETSPATVAVPTDPQALAEAVATAMWARDRAANALGMRIDEVRLVGTDRESSQPIGSEH